MKRKHAGADDADATAAAVEEAAADGGNHRVVLLDEAITVKALFEKDCDYAAQVSVWRDR